jgi:glycosyltransferase involved in cell wall biosynthesis
LKDPGVLASTLTSQVNQQSEFGNQHLRISPMTVLHVANGRLFGGIERMLATFAERGNAGFEFVVATDGRLLSELRDRDAHVHFFGDVRLSHPSSLLRARHQFRNLLRRRSYSAVICHAPWSHAIFAGVARSCGLPVILWQHDRASGTPLVERACRAAGADLVICNSKWTATTARCLQPQAPHRVIYCPVSATPAMPAETKRDVRKELDAPADAVVMLSASRMEPWKGHLELVRALAKLNALPWVLWIAGGAQRRREHAHATALFDEVRRLGLESRVKFLGERRDVDRLLAAADVLAQANTEPEPFGIVFAEALRAGVPVVTTDMGGAPEIVDDSCGRLVPADDPPALVNALRSLVSDRALRNSLGTAGPVRVATICDPSRVLTQLSDAISSLRMPTAAA